MALPPEIPPILVAQIDRPQAPAAPQASNPPTPNPLDPVERARSLAKRLLLKGTHDEVNAKRDEVKSELERDKASDPAKLGAIEQALGALSRDKKFAQQAYELRRIIRFVRNPPKPPPPRDPLATIPTRVLGPPDSDVTLDNLGTVRLHIGRRTGDYILTYTGPDWADMRWLQFIWRMAVLAFPAGGGTPRKVVKMRVERFTGIPFHLTTNEKEPRWFTDTSKDGEGFFEQDSTVKRSNGDFVLYDSPSASPAKGLEVEVFKLANPPDKMVSHFRAMTYLIHGMDVLYRADIHLAWDYTRSSRDPGPVSVEQAEGKKVQMLEPEHRACLARQHPFIDYLPGKLIGVPQPTDEFDLVPNLADTGWLTKTNMERYIDIAELAHAEWVVDNLDLSMMVSTFNTADPNPGRKFSDKFIHAGRDRARGLNLSGIDVEGQTGYIDANNVYRGSQLPADRNGTLPDIAIELGRTAFQVGNKVRDKACALGTMRHEMTHAAHAQLAIGWLLKWRDELTDTSLTDWLAKEHKDGRIGDVAFACVSTYITNPNDRRATEMLAWTEGLVTALRFLPPTPDFHTHMLRTEDFPGAISSLSGAGRFYDLLSSNEAVRIAARKRIRDVICGELTQSQRDALIAWLNILQDPLNHGVPKNRNHDEEGGFLLIKGFSAGFLKDVRVQVEKPCPRSTP